MIQTSESVAPEGAGVSTGDDLPQAVAELFLRAAGAIAHDLNNALMVISSYCELMVERKPAGDQTQIYAQRIQNATRKAAKLGDTLWEYSRTYASGARVIDLGAEVADLIPMLKGVAELSEHERGR